MTYTDNPPAIKDTGRDNFLYYYYQSRSTDYQPSYYYTGTYITDLDSGTYFLRNSQRVVTTQQHDCFRAEIDELGLWATGETISQALSEIKKEVIELYEELKEVGEHRLGPKPHQWWSLLKNLIIDNEQTTA